MVRENLFERTDSAKALELLKQGNKRFVSGVTAAAGDVAKNRRDLYEKGQTPFAIVLGCADSRTPPEIIFDVSVGQLFVVRNAGNVADAISVGSIEYAVEHLHARLIVVLGHDKCGAVAAAMSGNDFGPNIGVIAAEIAPAVNKMRAENSADSQSVCEDENAKNTAAKLAESAILKKYLADGTLKIAAAKYSLETGEVSFF